MFSTKKKITAAVALGFAGALVLSGCSMGEDTAETPTESAPETMETTAPETPEAEMMDPAANLVGPGCAEYAEAVPDGAGSIQGMSADPVAVAASNNPLLTTLVSAVSGELNPDVNLVDTLNGDEFTVFAPVDDAFAKIDEATIETLKTDSDMLSSILTSSFRARSSPLTSRACTPPCRALASRSPAAETSGWSMTPTSSAAESRPRTPPCTLSTRS